MSAYRDYRKDLDRVLDGITMQTRDAEIVSQVAELAELRGMTVDELDQCYDQMVGAFKKLHIPWTHTKPDFIQQCLQWSKKSN